MGVSSFLANFSFHNLIYFNIKVLPSKIKNNLEDRENKIKKDIDDANKFKELSETRLKEYERILENAKREVIKIHLESKNTLDKDIQKKRDN